MTFISLVPSIYYNIAQYGPVDPTGVADSSAAILDAYAAAKAASGGTIIFPAGTFISGNIPLLNNDNVSFLGLGQGITTLKLKNGANTDLISAYTSSINLAAAYSTGSATGANSWSIRNMTLDGNKANQTAGPSYPLRVYGYGELLENVEVINGYTGGILKDWNNTPDPTGKSVFARWMDLSVHINNGIGIEVGGPADQQWTNVNSFRNGSHNVHICPNAGGLQGNLCHFYGTPVGTNQYVAALIETSSCIFTNSQFEGSDVCQVVLLGGDSSLLGCLIYAAPAGAVIGVQLGQQASLTPYPGQIYQAAGVTTAIGTSNCMIMARFKDCQSGALNEANAGSNLYICEVSQSTGTAIASGGGYISSNSGAWIRVTGLTPDGTHGKGGIFQIAKSISFGGMQVFDGSSNALFQINSYNGGFAILNSKVFQGFSDAGVTKTLQINTTDGSIAMNGSLATGIATKTTTYTLTEGDSTILCNATTAAFTVTLPTAVGAQGRRYVIKKTDSSANAVTVATTSSQTIDGVTTKVLSTQYANVDLQSDNANWFII